VAKRVASRVQPPNPRVEAQSGMGRRRRRKRTDLVAVVKNRSGRMP
jgi:hypothetical protein